MKVKVCMDNELSNNQKEEVVSQEEKGIKKKRFPFIPTIITIIMIFLLYPLFNDAFFVEHEEVFMGDPVMVDKIGMYIGLIPVRLSWAVYLANMFGIKTQNNEKNRWLIVIIILLLLFGPELFFRLTYG